MEIYRPKRKKNKSLFNKYVLMFVIILILRVLSNNLIGFVFAANDLSTETFFTNTAVSKKPNTKKSLQKMFVATKLLQQRFSKDSLSIRNTPYQKGDLVLVDTRELSLVPNNQKGLVEKTLKKIIHFLSLGLFFEGKNYSLKKIIAIPGDEVVYTYGGLALVNENSIKYLPNAEVPFFDALHETTLQEDEYFLQGADQVYPHYNINQLIPVEKIKGKVIILLGPIWKWGI